MQAVNQLVWIPHLNVEAFQDALGDIDPFANVVGLRIEDQGYLNATTSRAQ